VQLQVRCCRETRSCCRHHQNQKSSDNILTSSVAQCREGTSKKQSDEESREWLTAEELTSQSSHERSVSYPSTAEPELPRTNPSIERRRRRSETAILTTRQADLMQKRNCRVNKEATTVVTNEPLAAVQKSSMRGHRHRGQDDRHQPAITEMLERLEKRVLMRLLPLLWDAHLPVEVKQSGHERAPRTKTKSSHTSFFATTSEEGTHPAGYAPGDQPNC